MAQPMPMPSERRAPKFEGDGRTLTQFLSDYKRLADAAQLTEAQAIERIVIYLAASPRKLVERYVEFRKPTTWDKFKDRFLEDYLDAEEPDEYRRADYDAFLVKSKAEPPKSVEKLGEFTREFRSMAADVQRAGGLGDVEMRKHFATVLEAAIGDEFKTRMLVEYKGKSRADWTIVDMLKQAKILLKEAEADADTYFPQKVGAATAPAASSSSSIPTVKVEEQLNVLFNRLNARIDQLERANRPSAAHVHVAPGATSTTATVATAAPAQVHVSSSAEPSCYYCGGAHRIPDCPLLLDDLAKGRCLRNEIGRIVYPNGEAIKGGFGGKMRDRVLEFNAAHPEYEKKGGGSVATMLVQLGDAYFEPRRDCLEAAEPSVEDAAQAWASFISGESFQYEEGERRQYNLRARQQPPNDAPKPHTKSPTRKVAVSSAPVVRDPPPHLEPGRVDRMPPSPSTTKEKSQTAGAVDRPGSAAAQPPTPAPRSATIEEVPDEDAPPPRALPRPVPLPSAMAAPRPQFQLRAPVESEGLAKIIGERILQSQVALTVQELLSVSPSLRRHWHNETAVKRVTIGYAGADEAEQDASVFQFERISQPTVSRDLIAAEVSLPLRYLDCFVGDFKAEGVVDNGSQLVLISQRFWQALGCPLDEERRISMTAANNSDAYTKGLCANLEVNIGGITWYLQAHVVEDAPFSLLLGRPFLCVAAAREDNLPDGSTFLTLNDPNSGRATRIPTRARRNPRSAAFAAEIPSGF